MPVTLFLVSKLIAHTLLGFFLGLLGSAITLSLGVRLAFQTFTAVFMFATAMNLIDVHPIFRFVVFQPPKFIQRIVRNSSKSKALFAPALLGFMTIFIPCGVTQAMEVLAINSGNPWYGALIMFSFVLGTSPLFAVLGIATAKLAEGWYKNFTRFAAVILVGMALYSLNGVLIVMNSPVSSKTIMQPLREVFSGPPEWYQEDSGQAAVSNTVTINVLNSGYSPRYVRVKSGEPVTLTLQSDDTYSCALAFVLSEFGINTFLESTDSQTFTFTPTKPGKYTFTCSMGMYTGTLEVI
ncbi:sulfite exporter TauE/SafE family protein [Candidatus Woesebacteria bacterium]|nr:sulfite exporter TauE/SafE family protein [Candidatus Woesebacteria bacterium]